MAGRPKGSRNKTASAKPQKAEKAPKPPKAAKPAKAANPPRPDAKHFNKIDTEQKALFLQHLPLIEKLKASVASATGKLRSAYKTAKSEGFTKKDFDDAFAMQTPEAEKVKKAVIARTLLIARYMGADMGAQFDLFSEDERVPAVDRAYQEGQTASMTGKSLAPPHDPSTEQYRAWTKGWHDHQGQIAKGIKKLDTEKAALAKEDGDTESQIDMPPPEGSPAAKKAAAEPVTSGVPTTRSEFMKRQADLETGGGKPN